MELTLGWEIFKIESKQMRDICLRKFGNISCKSRVVAGIKE
jgi:hypothetical protein